MPHSRLPSLTHKTRSTPPISNAQSLMRRFLHTIAAKLTRKPRRMLTPGVDFQWRNADGTLFIHVLFRAWEMLFGYPCIRNSDALYTDEIKPSIFTGNDTGFEYEIAYSFEGQIALFETFIRSLVKKLSPKLVYIPQPALAGLSHDGISPYRFAIAFDNEADTANVNTNTLATKTNTGSNVGLVVYHIGDISASNTLTGITYNSVAMTFAAAIRAFQPSPTDRWLNCYVQGASATGSHSVVASGSTFGGIGAMSYTGCNSTLFDASGVANGSTSPNSVSITVVNANSWLTGISYAPAGQGSSGGSAVRNNPAASLFGSGLIDSNAANAAGAQSLACTATAGTYQFLAVSIQPVATVATPPSIISDLIIFN